MIDFVQNNASIAQTLLANGMDIHALRPFRADDGKCYITNSKGTVENSGQPAVIPVTNATLHKNDWILLDQAVNKTAKLRLRLVADLLAAGLKFDVPNAMGTMTLEYQNISDSRTATTSMDGLTKSNAQRPEFDLTGIPLPITHSDFFFSAREIEVARRNGWGLDTAQAESAAIAVSEQIEQMFWGTAGTIKYGGRTLYGVTNFPNIVTDTLTSWAATGKTMAQRFADVLAMKAASVAAKRFGPYVLYVPTEWEKYLDDDYETTTATGRTLRQRLLQIDGITDVKLADYMPTGKLALIQMTNDVLQVVNGLAPTVVQWQEQGGMALNFKVMSIMAPRIRSDYNTSCGITIFHV